MSSSFSPSLLSSSFHSSTDPKALNFGTLVAIEEVPKPSGFTAGAGAKDDAVLVNLHEDGQIAMVHDVPSEYAHRDDDHANDAEHLLMFVRCSAADARDQLESTASLF